MLTAAVILLAVNLLLLAGLLLASLRNANTLTRLRADAEALKPLHAELGPELRQQLTESGDRVIGIEILNPLQVAAGQSWVAGRFGALAPGLIQREVYRQTREILETQLREYGIEPRVRVHGSRS